MEEDDEVADKQAGFVHFNSWEVLSNADNLHGEEHLPIPRSSGSYNTYGLARFEEVTGGKVRTVERLANPQPKERSSFASRFAMGSTKGTPCLQAPNVRAKDDGTESSRMTPSLEIVKSKLSKEKQPLAFFGLGPICMIKSQHLSYSAMEKFLWGPFEIGL